MINRKFKLVPIKNTNLYFKIPITNKLKNFIKLVTENINELNNKVDCILHTHISDLSFRYSDIKVVRIIKNREVASYYCKNKYIHFNNEIYFTCHIEEFNINVTSISLPIKTLT